MRKIKQLLFTAVIIAGLPQLLQAQANMQKDGYVFQESVWKDSIAYKKFGGKDSIHFQWLPITNTFQWVQEHPTDWNDGAMIQAKGLQQYLRMGMQIQWKNFELQIAPEMVLAQNQYFETLSDDLDQVIWRDYYRWYNSIELPAQMGTKQYKRFLGGQSFFKYRYKKLSLSVSTENKWWGPTQRNALILSNTAAGFLHLSFKTEKPIKTKIGNLQFEFLTGGVENGSWAPPGDWKALYGNRLYVYKPRDQRIVSGFHVNVQPKWVPDLTLGVAQTFMQYQHLMKNAASYFPIKNIFNKFQNDAYNNPITLTSFYFNYKLKEANAKIYGEFGWNLNRTTLRNWIIQPDKGFASTIGIQKTLTTQKNYDWEILAEVTQTQLLTRAEQFSTWVPPSWYIGQDVKQGYTHNGQLLGAGVGPGGSSQMIELNWRQKNNRIGLNVERRVHNNDFLVFAYTKSSDFRRFFVDFTSTLKVDWQFKKMTLGPRISYINSNNYYWYLFQVSDLYYIPGRDIKQFTAQLTLQYHL